MQETAQNNPTRKPESSARRRRLGASPPLFGNHSVGNSTSSNNVASVRPSLTLSNNNNCNSPSGSSNYCCSGRSDISGDNNKLNHQQHQRKPLLLVSLFCFFPAIFLYCELLTRAISSSSAKSILSSFSFVRRRLLGSPLSSDQIPLMIPSLSQDNEHYGFGGGDGRDLGGWFIGSQNHYKPETTLENSGLNDYGGLIFLSLNDNDDNGNDTTHSSKKSKTTRKKKMEFRRTIRENDYDLYHEERKMQIRQMDGEHISRRHWFDDELEDYNAPDGCRRQSWEKLHYPNCNSFHEIDLSRYYDTVLAKRIGDEQAGDSKYLSHGYFRDVFSLEQPSLNNNNNNNNHYRDDPVRRATSSSGRSSKAVLKVARYTKHEMNFRPLYNAKRDALIMERLSASPNIVDIFGHCGASVMVESLPHEVEEVIVPGGGWIKQKDLHDSRDVDVQNHYTVKEKLDIAIAMAQSISELHGFRDGVIVHDDIQLCQWLRNDEGKLKLGDFNRARVLAWNDKKQKYCKYDNGRSYGNYRSPEEYGEKPLSQQHDVWSFGNNIYALLTGLWIFYENEDDEVVADKIINGTRPFIDPRYRNRSFIEGRLVEIMEKCWVYDLDKRPDIFEILKLLQKLEKESDTRDKRS